MKHAARVGYLLPLLLTLSARADLSGDVQTILGDKLLQNTTVGIEVVRLEPGERQSSEIYHHDGHTPLTPASNLKLATTSAALDRLGPDFKFRTLLVRHGQDLVLIGDGDPTFGDAEYLKRFGWKPTKVYEDWAERLRKLNVTSVRDVIVDDSVFDEEFLHPNWPVRQIDHWYVAEAGGMNFNANCVGFWVQPTAPGARVEFALVPPTHYVTVQNSCITGQNDVQLGRKPGTNEITLRGQAVRGNPTPVAETIHDPPMYAATVLAETLEAAGIKVSGTVRRDRSLREQRAKSAAAQWIVVGIHETPLLVAMARANKDSINLYAECLCKRIGFEQSHSSGSWKNGTDAVRMFLAKAGAPSTEFRLDDGSGLSKQNAISPNALVHVLTYDFFSKNHEAFASTLAVAGVDGTLEDRFRGSDLRRRVMAKSGFVEGVSCLSGYHKAKDDQWYAFSIMMNHVPHGGNGVAKALQEKIVRAIDNTAATTTAKG